MIFSLLFLTCLPHFSFAAPSPSSLTNSIIIEFLNDIPEGFAAHGPPASDTALEFRIALRQNNIAELEEEFYAVRDLESDHHGKHVVGEEVEEFLRPTPGALAAVNAWLTENDISTFVDSPSGDWLRFSIPVDMANELLEAKFTTFRREKDGFEFIRTLSYSIPASLKEHIDFIHPTISFPGPPSEPKDPLFNVPTPIRKARDVTDEVKSTIIKQSVPASSSTTLPTL